MNSNHGRTIMTFRLWLYSLGPLVCTAAPATAADLADSTETTQFSDAVVLYVRDLDVWRMRYPDLRAELQLIGGVKDEIRHDVDLGADYQPPAIILLKKEAVRCSEVAATIRNGTELLLEASIPLEPEVHVETKVPLLDKHAFIEPGAHVGEHPKIALPDLSNAPLIELDKAPRTLELSEIAARVECDFNWPLISAKNNCAISRQTDHASDPARRSAYLPLKSQIYDRETGRPVKVVHYLAEVPLRSEWLEGHGDTTIVVPPEEMKIHASDQTWPPNRPSGQNILGQSASGLGQLSFSVQVDADGNIYYSAVPSMVVRFNVSRAAFETPPIDLDAHFRKRLPSQDDMPEGIRGKKAIWDSYKLICVGGRRLFFLPTRNGVYGNTMWSAIYSIPLDNWDDPDKFKAGLRFHAGSWPTAEHSFYDSWPVEGDAGRKLHAPRYVHNRLFVSSYPGARGGPWRLDLDERGNTIDFGTVEEMTARHGRIPEVRQSTGLCTVGGGRLDWWNYGVLLTDRTKLNGLLTGTVEAKPDGSLTICYDAIAAMRREPNRFAEVLGSLSGPSLGPCYMAVHIPDSPGHVLGVGEYGYYLADLDLSTAESGKVSKRYLKLDAGASPVSLPLRLGLGPYGHAWVRHGNERWLYIGGYTGLTRLRYSVEGKPLPTFTMERFDTDLEFDRADGAPAGGIKRYRYLMPGLDDRLFLTGTHTAARAGTAYSGGLMTFKVPDPATCFKLSKISRAYHTTELRSRMVQRPDGVPVQEFSLQGGGPVAGYLNKMDESEVPANKDARVFFYDYARGGPPRDLFGFSQVVVNGQSAVDGQAFSQDRRYLITYQHGCLLTFDMASKRFIDAKRLDLTVWRFDKPKYRFLRTPDDRLMLYASGEDKSMATFYEIVISPVGAVSLHPVLTLKATDEQQLQATEGAVVAFVPDAAKADGSYNLMLGPYWRRQATHLWLIRDFVPPRASGS